MCHALWLWGCRYRVARLLHTVAQRLRKHTRRVGAFHAWNKCLNHLLALARAHQASWLSWFCGQVQQKVRGFNLTSLVSPSRRFTTRMAQVRSHLPALHARAKQMC